MMWSGAAPTCDGESTQCGYSECNIILCVLYSVVPVICEDLTVPTNGAPLVYSDTTIPRAVDSTSLLSLCSVLMMVIHTAAGCESFIRLGLETFNRTSYPIHFRSL